MPLHQKISQAVANQKKAEEKKKKRQERIAKVEAEILKEKQLLEEDDSHIQECQSTFDSLISLQSTGQEVQQEADIQTNATSSPLTTIPEGSDPAFHSPIVDSPFSGDLGGKLSREVDRRMGNVETNLNHVMAALANLTNQMHHLNVRTVPSAQGPQLDQTQPTRAATYHIGQSQSPLERTQEEDSSQR